MPDPLPNLLYNQDNNAVFVPDHLPLVCLTFYLFLDFDDEETRATQLQDLFYKYENSDFFQKLQSALEEDPQAKECLAMAQEAIKKKEIEPYERDTDFQNYENDNKINLPEFYTISFLIWAEKTGFNIPQLILKELQNKIEIYAHNRSYREEYKLNFPYITQEEFNFRVKEPLWNMTDALLYVLGYKSNRNDDQKVDFLKYKKRVKRLTKYILDARQTGDLKLHGFDDHLYDHDQKDIEEKRLKSFYKSRVKPKEFITFLSGLSLDLPIIEQYIYPDEPTVEEASLPKPLEFEAILHPIIIKGAYKQYQNEHFRDAALNSIVAVFDYLREKTGLRDDGDRLVSKAFALENPFIILSNIATESGRNDQKGFMNIFKGAYLGIRNPKAHTLETNLTKEKTAQYLIFASLLARRIDEATFPKQNGNLGTKSGGTVLIK